MVARVAAETSRIRGWRRRISLVSAIVDTERLRLPVEIADHDVEQGCFGAGWAVGADEVVGPAFVEGRLPRRIWRRFLVVWLALAVVSMVVTAATWIDGGGPWWIAAVFTLVAAVIVANAVAWSRLPHDWSPGRTRRATWRI